MMTLHVLVIGAWLVAQDYFKEPTDQTFVKIMRRKESTNAMPICFELLINDEHHCRC